MSRGYVSGVIWGSLVGAVGLAVASQLAPPPARAPSVAVSGGDIGLPGAGPATFDDAAAPGAAPRPSGRRGRAAPEAAMPEVGEPP
ncbi:hypothetical protein FAZ78_21785, partial [Cereibacter changlensis]